MWYMLIDHSFFPSTDVLTTYVDDCPKFTKKQLVVLGSSNGEEFDFMDNENEKEVTSHDSKVGLQEEKLNIEKIYHAQCLENYPNHFAAFVKLSKNASFPSESDQMIDGIILFFMGL